MQYKTTDLPTEKFSFICCYAPINIMPHYPLLGYIGEIVGRLTRFDTKTCPIRGKFDRSPYACAMIKAPTVKFPIFSSTFGWGEIWDLTNRCVQ